jgi:hypothetical protein
MNIIKILIFVDIDTLSDSNNNNNNLLTSYEKKTMITQHFQHLNFVLLFIS